ncbi:hypothetical protein JDV02_006785 [Purpureocillium takamizusanense]|uniref:Uncharacterized protein n=1 Tax=Purpureocillium takamizusanense TaxID=2060973 RepID=A0A9Q8VBN8_9HYPO|nr:uncharacterized protein JDV02_006785 [Purpureocillium takamizusanense]UNI20720.1 hypothetical protein JDV02_006785 [Purpureocillium takamizusanense]
MHRRVGPKTESYAKRMPVSVTTTYTDWTELSAIDPGHLPAPTSGFVTTITAPDGNIPCGNVQPCGHPASGNTFYDNGASIRTGWSTPLIPNWKYPVFTKLPKPTSGSSTSSSTSSTS